jgi:hypothetical protein
MKVKKLSLTLPCQYTDAELADKRDALADITIAIDTVENRKSDAAKAFKEELDGMYANCGKLAHQIRAREEHRLIDCIVEMNKPQVGEKTTIRLDTGEMLKVEVMTDAERQEEIDFGLEENRDIQKMIEDAHKSDEPPQETAGA